MIPLPYLNPTLPLHDRLRDLISRMTLAEKISQMNNNAAAIPRLGIPAYDYWSEALHGVARNGRATVFPQAIGLAATWDPALIHEVASATGDEARAKYHEALRTRGETLGCQGLTEWSPNINIFRDPRWGRGQETYGEDPTLTGEIGAAFVRGLQGDDPRYLKTAACAKHYAAHSGPEKLRHGFDARVSLRDLGDTYLPAFRKLVMEAGVEAVMGAYNRLNGEPCCASPFLIEQKLRGEWGFQGHFVSDAWAIEDFHQGHAVTQDAVESAALALKTGCDLCAGPSYENLAEALRRGLITEADIDRALSRHYATRFKLGMFDPPEQVPYAAIPMSVVGCAEHRALAYSAAVESIVLLKNNGVLPIDPALRSLFITGPNAANLDALLGNYYGIGADMTSVLEGIAASAPEGLHIEYRLGSQHTQPGQSRINWAVDEAIRSELTVACMGLSPALEGEEGESILSDDQGDRREIGLPAVQVQFLKDLAAGGAKVVLVVFSGSPVSLAEVEDLVEAIVQVWYPGQEGGRAVAGVLFGREVPSGRLPVSVPRSVEQLPPYEDYSMKDRTYRYATWEPLYPFGFGLSYTAFAYSNLALDRRTLPAGEPLALRFTLANTGPVEAEEVAQVYLSDLEASVPVPFHKLVAFRRVRLAPGEQQEVAFELPASAMALIDETGRERLEPGRFRVIVGGCSPGERGVSLGAAEPLIAEFVVQ